MAQSLFNFRFRLLPWEACLHFNVAGVELSDRVGVVCTRNELGLLMVGDPAQNDAMRAQAHQLARGLVHGHAFCSYPTGAFVDVEPIAWLEVPDWTPSEKPTVTGYMHASLASVPLTPEHKDNVPLRDAATIIRDAGSNPSVYLALADFHAAHREAGLYGAFYAFRVLEDVGYMFGVAKNDKPDWDAMNRAFGTKEADWKRLTDAGTRARHMQPGALATLTAIERAELLNLAHDALAHAIRYVRGPKPKWVSLSSSS